MQAQKVVQDIAGQLSSRTHPFYASSQTDPCSGSHIVTSLNFGLPWMLFGGELCSILLTTSSTYRTQPLEL